MSKKLGDLIIEDLRWHLEYVVKDARALSAFLDIRPEIIEQLRAAGDELLHEVGTCPMVSDPVAAVNYAGMEPRSAALLDVAFFGEARSITEIQDSVLAHGFAQKRRGVIRSSINATFNRNFFKVDKKEMVTLTEQGRAEADRLLMRYRKRIA